jgi:hypothetical protein
MHGLYCILHVSISQVHGNWLKRLHTTTVSNHASQEVMACIKIALRCVETDRVQRPTITEILSELANIGTDESLLKATSEVYSHSCITGYSIFFP